MEFEIPVNQRLIDPIRALGRNDPIGAIIKEV